MAETENLSRVNTLLDLSRLRRAHALFTPNGSTDVFVNTLEGLGTELSNRAMAIRNTPGITLAMREYVMRASTLSAAISYASDRLSELLTRHEQISQMRAWLSYETRSDVFAQVSDPNAERWRKFMGLAIKDFHIDIGSLMDALAPIVIQFESKLASKGNDRLPGWAEIDGSKDRSKYRKQLADELRNIVDSTQRWFPAIRTVRHLVTHRKHDRIIFGNAEDGLLFQVYDQSRSPKIVLPQLLYQKGHDVVDFDLYSAFVIAEVVTLFDDIGTAIAPKTQVSQKSIAQMSLRVVAKSVGQSIEHLIQMAGQPDVGGPTQS